MAKDGLLTLACAAVMVLIGPSLGRAGPGDENSLSDTLAVQSAMQQAREHLLRNRPQEAVLVLHRELGHINGNPAYLALLRDAYQATIKELRLAHLDSEAERYVKLLSVLEPKTARELADRQAAPKSKTTSAQAPGSNSKPSAPVSPVPLPTVVRGSIDEDPFNDSRPGHAENAKGLLKRAEQAFDSKKFVDAGKLYEQAHQTDSRMAEDARERWAYCKLFHVVELLNQFCKSGSPNGRSERELADLEKEASDALVLAPRLDYARQLLSEIRKRRRPADDAVHEYRDLGRNAQGWFVGETANFLVYHVQSPDLARKTAEIAEQTRTRMYNKWFGRVASDWNPKCQIFLYPTSQDYCRATGVPGGSPGHSSFNLDGGRVMGRQIDLHCEDPDNMLSAVLPHETTHVVLAGNFGDHVVPRWVDEGVAVLTEPHEKVLRHLVKLPGFYRNRQLLEVGQLLRMDDYPDPRYVDAFYAESVSVVEFLSKEKGEQTFTQFVREGLQNGYESALQRHYGFQSFADLQQHWLQYAFGNPSSPYSTTSKMR
jgi:hypothetical protein